VHGLADDFLKKQPVFADIADGFLEFIADSVLVIHNATFDMGFINAELDRIDHEPLSLARTVDTVEIARRKFPGSPANLDALCKRFQIDNSGRDLHGALKDARLLADVYLELVGGREPGLTLSSGTAGSKPAARNAGTNQARQPRSARAHAPTADELAAHEKFMESITDPLWRAAPESQA